MTTPIADAVEKFLTVTNLEDFTMLLPTTTTMGTESIPKGGIGHGRLQVHSDSEQYSRKVMSNDSRYAGLPGTPQPVICEFCGEERHTEGRIIFGDTVVWYPGGAAPCSCPGGNVSYESERKQNDERKEAEKQLILNYKMREHVKQVIKNSGIGERFAQCAFENFVQDTKVGKKTFAFAYNYAKDFDKLIPRQGQPIPERNGIWITGDVGIGKTHIAAAIANHLLHCGTAVICMNERNLYGEIKRTYKKNGGDEGLVREVYETVPLLIIDDLGKEKATDWTLATLYAIIDGRYERGMPLIVTTNYDAEYLIERITPQNLGKAGDTTTAIAIVDRLVEMCHGVVMRGKSWRDKKGASACIISDSSRP